MKALKILHSKKKVLKKKLFYCIRNEKNVELF